MYVGKIGTKLIDAFTTIYALMGKVINESSQGLTINMASGIVRQAIIIILNIIIPVLIVAVIIAILGNMLQQRWMVTGAQTTFLPSALTLLKNDAMDLKGFFL